MKKSVIIISLFLLGTIFSVKAQEMTQKEKINYAIGAMLGEKIKEEIQKSGIDMNIIESIKEKLKEKIDLGSIKEGLQDILKGESKLAKEEIMTIFAELEKEIDYYKKIIETNQKKGNEGNENEEEKPSEPVTYLTILANNHGRLSWYYLFINDYIQSEQSARRALELDNTQIWVKTNLAHALLFQNRFSEAEKIYKELSQILRDNKPYTQVLLEDFEALEKAGVIPEKHKADVEKIRKMLRK